MKDLAVRIAVPATRLYIRYFPLKLGKSWLWHRVVRKYLAWRPLELRARSRDGLLFLGSFPDFIHTFIYFFGVWEPNQCRHTHAARVTAGGKHRTSARDRSVTFDLSPVADEPYGQCCNECAHLPGSGL